MSAPIGRPLLFSLVWLIWIGIHGSPGHAQCELDKLTASDGAQYDSFGAAVSVSGDVIVVGAREHNDAGSDSGSAYVYRFDGIVWEQEAELLPSDGDEYDIFGGSASVSGDVIVVGAPFDDDAGAYSGSAYVYRYEGGAWVEEAKLTASDAAADDSFGWSVSASSDVVVVGAPYNDDAGAYSGSAYVYRYDGNTWIEEAKLTASDAAQGDFFGGSVSVSGEAVVVGASYDSDAGTWSGSAYVYRDDGGAWIEEAKLTASDAAVGDSFGWSVSVSGDVAVVGAVENCTCSVPQAPFGPGSAYAFRWDGAAWLEEAKLTASDGEAEDWFGAAVSVSGDVAVVGAFGDGGGGYYGSAYAYRWNGNEWLEEAKLTASDMAPADAFGAAVAVSGDVAVAGAHLDDDAGDASGSAHVFLLGVPGCEGSFVRGDCNNDGANNIADAIFFLGFLFPGPGGSPPLACLDACDANDDGVLDIADAISTLASLFANPPIPLPAPYPDCGEDPSGDMLICGGYAHCP